MYKSLIYGIYYNAIYKPLLVYVKQTSTDLDDGALATVHAAIKKMLGK